MNLSALAGNRSLKAQLSQQEEGRGLSHAYILSGPAGCGKHTLARILCGAMVCTAPAADRPCGRCVPRKKVFGGIHPDVAVISGPGEGKPITVDQVRQLRADDFRPHEQLCAAAFRPRAARHDRQRRDERGRARGVEAQ